MSESSLDKIISLCKRRGFIFQSSEIYGGFGAVYDYGPLGVELKNNISHSWWKFMTHNHENIVGLDSGIFMHPKIWEASGHVDAFNDPLVDCKQCKARYRADELIKEDFMNVDSNIQKVLDCCDYDYLKVSKFISDSEKVFFIGKNLSFPIVNEGSLKIQEISKINSNSFIEGELKHGPNALLDKNSTIISIIGPDENIKKSISSLREIASRNANIITISFVENSEIQELSNYNFVIENNNKYIFPILSVIPLQKLAFMSALNLGLDPDRPQNLAKTVTVE